MKDWYWMSAKDYATFKSWQLQSKVKSRKGILPVISPSSEDASKMDGVLNTKVAVPVAPSRDRVRLTSGMEGSLTPLMNWMSAAMHTVSLASCLLPCRLEAPAEHSLT